MWIVKYAWQKYSGTFILPCTTRASSGRSVLMPTLPAWYTLSGAAPLCHPPSAPTPLPSDSNCPGLLACDNASCARVRKVEIPKILVQLVIVDSWWCIECIIIDFTYPDDYTFRRVSHYLITGLIRRVSVQSDNQMKISLIRIRFSLLAHVIARGFAKVQTTDRHFRNTFATQLYPGTRNTQHDPPSRRIRLCRFIRVANKSSTHVTGWNGFLLLSLWLCSTRIVCDGDSTLTP